MPYRTYRPDGDVGLRNQALQFVVVAEGADYGSYAEGLKLLCFGFRAHKCGDGEVGSLGML